MQTNKCASLKYVYNVCAVSGVAMPSAGVVPALLVARSITSPASGLGAYMFCILLYGF